MAVKENDDDNEEEVALNNERCMVEYDDNDVSRCRARHVEPTTGRLSLPTRVDSRLAERRTRRMTEYRDMLQRTPSILACSNSGIGLIGWKIVCVDEGARETST